MSEKHLLSLVIRYTCTARIPRSRSVLCIVQRDTMLGAQVFTIHHPLFSGEQQCLTLTFRPI